MKKFTAILMAVLMIAGLFVSCNNNAPVVDETVSVSFDESSSRSLTASLENFNKDDYYWKYAAKKADASGLTSGETSSYNANGALWIKGGSDANAPTGTGLGSVAGFSQGKWDFMLFAYKAEESDTGESATTTYKLVFQGEATGVTLKKGSDNSVMVSVTPVEEEKGTLKIDDGITFVPKKQSDTPTGLTKYYTVIKLGSEDSISPTTGTNEWTLEAGAYKVNVDFVKDGYTYASGSVVATVYSNLTTTVSGQLNELVTEAVFDPSINPDVMNRVASSEPKDYSSITEDIALSESVETGAKVEAIVPKTAVAEAVKQVLGRNAVAGDTVSMSVSVNTTSATSNSLTLEIGMSATVSYNNEQGETVVETKPVSDFGDGNIIAVQVELQKNLQNVKVTHKGVAMNAISAENSKGYSYDAETGILTIKTSSFSPFGISYDEPVYVAKVGSTSYTTLQGAIDAATEGSVVTLEKDVELTSAVKVNKNIILDLNGFNISSFESRALVVEAGTLTISGTGIIESTLNTINDAKDYSVIKVGSNVSNTPKVAAGLIVGENVTVKSTTSYGIVVMGKGTSETVTINGEVITQERACISGNGSFGYDGTNITINGKVTLNESSTRGENVNAIYHPQSGTLVINGTVYGGIEAKAGTITISESAKVYAESGITDHTPYSNGCSTQGYAIAAVNNTAYSGEPNITINGGIIEGDIVIVDDDEDPSNNNATIVVNKGSFTKLDTAIKYAVDNAVIGLIDDDHLSSVLEIGKSITINGNGHSIYNSANRVIRITAPNINVKLYDLGIISECTATSDVRGISFDDTSSGSSLLLDGCTVSASFYAINIITGASNLNITIKNGTVAAGWAAINSYSNNSTFTIENSVLKGLNDKGESSWNDFATIVFDGNGLWDSSNIGKNGSGNTMKISNSTIYASSDSSNNQAWLAIQYGALNNTINLSSDVKVIDENGCNQLDNATIVPFVGYNSSQKLYAKSYDVHSILKVGEDVTNICYHGKIDGEALITGGVHVAYEGCTGTQTE